MTKIFPRKAWIYGVTDWNQSMKRSWLESRWRRGGCGASAAPSSPAGLTCLFVMGVLLLRLCEGALRIAVLRRILCEIGCEEKASEP
jgi:hypothetical protein